MGRFTNPFKFGTDPWDPSHRYETSWLLPPYALAAVRACFGLYGIIILLYSIGYYCTQPALGGCAQARDQFSYFTVLTYWGLAFYNLTAAAHTLSYAHSAHHTGRGHGHGTLFIERLPRPLQALHAFYYTTVTTYPFIVTAVYWGLIYGGAWFTTDFAALTNVSEHAMNSGFALFEIVVPRTPPPPWVHAWWSVVLLALYLALAYVTFYTKGFYTYTFLDIQAQGSAITAAYIVGIAVGAVVVFSIVKGVVHLRVWATERKGGGRDGKFAGEPLGSRGTDVDGSGSGSGPREGDVEMGRLEKLGSGNGTEGSPVSAKTAPRNL